MAIRSRPGWPRIGKSWVKAVPGSCGNSTQPGGRVTKDRGAVLLQRHQILQGIHPGVEAGGNQASEHTGNVGAVLGGKE
jgi:hypothetical protein